MTQIATVFGLIWAGLVIASGMVANVGIGAVADLWRNDPVQARSVWLVIEIVQLGLGGGPDENYNTLPSNSARQPLEQK